MFLSSYRGRLAHRERPSIEWYLYPEGLLPANKMSGRNLRTQSQPRPRPSTRRSDSFGENVNDNARPQRRSQSSMRYKAPTRDSSRQRSRGGDPSMNPKTPSNAQSLRAKSAGRMRSNVPPSFSTSEKDDPASMAQQILELMERRESKRESPLRVRPDLTMSYSNHSHKQPNKLPSSPKYRGGLPVTVRDGN